MSPQTIILHGPSGAGKGTQGALLKAYLENQEPKQPVVYVATGQLFRNFMQDTTYAARRVKEILDEGGLLPEFLPVWIWTDYLNQYIRTGNEHIIFDGAVRRRNEAPMMDSALTFFKRTKPIVLVLNVSRERAIEQLKNRGRYDDNDEDIKARLDWYEKNVIPAIEYFKSNPLYRVEEINGEQGIEEVQQEILRRLNW